MKIIEKIAIKYFLILIGVMLLKPAVITFHHHLIFALDIEDPVQLSRKIILIAGYLINIIVGIFILVDSIKHLKNKVLISILGFCLPIFGVCFLLIEKYFLLKTIENE